VGEGASPRGQSRTDPFRRSSAYITANLVSILATLPVVVTKITRRPLACWESFSTSKYCALGVTRGWSCRLSRYQLLTALPWQSRPDALWRMPPLIDGVPRILTPATDANRPKPSRTPGAANGRAGQIMIFVSSTCIDAEPAGSTMPSIWRISAIWSAATAHLARPVVVSSSPAHSILALTMARAGGADRTTDSHSRGLAQPYSPTRPSSRLQLSVNLNPSPLDDVEPRQTRRSRFVKSVQPAQRGSYYLPVLQLRSAGSSRPEQSRATALATPRAKMPSGKR